MADDDRPGGGRGLGAGIDRPVVDHDHVGEGEPGLAHHVGVPQLSSVATRFSGSNRPVALLAAPRPLRGPFRSVAASASSITP